VQRPHRAIDVPAAAALTAAELVLGQPLRGFGLQAYCRFDRPLMLASWQVLSPQQGSGCPGFGKMQVFHCCTHVCRKNSSNTSVPRLTRLMLSKTIYEEGANTTCAAKVAQRML
jgi:hypothetical protein